MHQLGMRLIYTHMHGSKSVPLGITAACSLLEPHIYERTCGQTHDLNHCIFTIPIIVQLHHFYFVNLHSSCETLLSGNPQVHTPNTPNHLRSALRLLADVSVSGTLLH